MNVRLYTYIGLNPYYNDSINICANFLPRYLYMYAYVVINVKLMSVTVYTCSNYGEHVTSCQCTCTLKAPVTHIVSYHMCFDMLSNDFLEIAHQFLQPDQRQRDTVRQILSIRFIVHV